MRKIELIAAGIVSVFGLGPNPVLDRVLKARSKNANESLISDFEKVALDFRGTYERRKQEIVGERETR